MTFRRSLRPPHQRHAGLFPNAVRLLKVGLVMIAVVFIFTVTVYSRILTVEYVDIDARGGIDPNAVRAVIYSFMDTMRYGIFPQKNIIVLSPRRLKRALALQFVIESITIKKKFPNTLTLAIVGKPFRLLLVNQKKVFDLSPDGTPLIDFSDDREAGTPTVAYARALARAEDVMRVGLPQQELDAPIVIYDSDETLKTVTVTFIERLYESIRTAGYHPLYFIFDSKQGTLIMNTRDGWRAFFAVQEDPARQIAHIKTIMDTYFREGGAGLDYIDARFDNRLFYKTR